MIDILMLTFSLLAFMEEPGTWKDYGLMDCQISPKWNIICDCVYGKSIGIFCKRIAFHLSLYPLIQKGKNKEKMFSSVKHVIYIQIDTPSFIIYPPHLQFWLTLNWLFLIFLSNFNSKVLPILKASLTN